MRWIEETRIMRLPDAEVGMFCKIRLGFKNRLEAHPCALDDIFGPGWRERSKNLVKAGILAIDAQGDNVVFQTIASGDKHREQVKVATKKYRTNRRATNTKILAIVKGNPT